MQPAGRLKTALTVSARLAVTMDLVLCTVIIIIIIIR